LLFDK